MFRNQQSKRVLFLARETRPVLERMLEAVWPGIAVETVGVDVATWFPKLAEPDVGGLAVLSDDVAAPALHAMHAVLQSRPELSALLLSGGRGLAGVESLLALPNVAVLPEPWTPVGFEQIAAATAAPQPVAAQPASAPVPAAQAHSTAAAGNPSAGISFPEVPPPLPPEEAVATPPPTRPLADTAQVAQQPPWAAALAVELRHLQDQRERLQDEVQAATAAIEVIRGHLADEDRRKAETIQAQMLELAHLRNDRNQVEQERAREELLRAMFHHRDKLADLLADTRVSAPRTGIAAVLRSLDEFLATQGIVTEENPDPEDAQLTRVIGSRPRAAGDPPINRIVRRPAFLKVDEGERRVLRPAEIETLTDAAPGGLH